MASKDEKAAASVEILTAGETKITSCFLPLNNHFDSNLVPLKR